MFKANEIIDERFPTIEELGPHFLDFLTEIEKIKKDEAVNNYPFPSYWFSVVSNSDYLSNYL